MDRHRCQSLRPVNLGTATGLLRCRLCCPGRVWKRPLQEARRCFSDTLHIISDRLETAPKEFQPVFEHFYSQPAQGNLCLQTCVSGGDGHKSPLSTTYSVTHNTLASSGCHHSVHFIATQQRSQSLLS